MFGNEGVNPNFDYDTIFIRIADQFKNHIGMTTNTDITTDLDGGSGVWTEVPITGTTVFMDSSFQVNGNGIECNYNGRVKITASLHLIGTGQRSESGLRILFDGVGELVQTSGAYNRFVGDLGSPTITFVTNCTIGEVITLQNRQEGINSVTTMVNVGSSMLLVERI